jgi:PAS domain S-box-containing protein
LIEWTNTALTDEDGRLEFLVGTGVDITDLRAEQARLEATQRKFLAFMDSIPANTYSKDRKGRLTYVNKKVEQSMKAESKDLLGKTNFDFSPEHIAMAATAEDERVWKSREPLNFYRVEPREEGDRHWMITKFLFEEEPGQEALGAAAIDVTAIKTAEERLRLATDVSFDCLAIMKPVRNESGAIADFEIEHTNAALAKYLHCSPEELVGSGLLARFSVKTVRTVFELCTAAIESGEPAEITIVAETPGNEGRWMLVKVQKVGDGVALKMRDVTVEREKEKELREQACLIEALRLRIRELEEHKKRAA